MIRLLRRLSTAKLWLLITYFALLAAAIAGCTGSEDEASGTFVPIAGTCEDRCNEGDKRCVTGGYQECLMGECLDWGTIHACPAGEACSQGSCQTSCTSECSEGSKKCNDDGTGALACKEASVGGCWAWDSATPCPMGETCSAGVCSSECKDECKQDARTCEADGFKVCGNFDADACLEWGKVTACAMGETCADGFCASECTNECTSGAVECVGSGGVHKCGNFDADSCLEWGSLVPCAQGETCSNGVCSSTCTDECAGAGVKECTTSGAGYQVCEKVAGCLLWGLTTSCGADESCVEGACVTTCGCDFYPNVCEADGPGSTTACACDADCSGTSACGSDSHCDTWCPNDPDCNCACDYNEYCEADANGSATTCTCDPDCEANEIACSDDGHCDTFCPSGADPDCGADACRTRWMVVGYREANEMSLYGSYTNPDPDEGTPWVLLSPNLASGSAEAFVELAAENKSCVDSIRFYAWGYDDAIFGDGAEMYIYNWDTFQFDLLPDQTIGSTEGWYLNTVSNTSPYLLCGSTYCYINVKLGASSFDNTHFWDVEVSVHMKQ